MKRVATYVRVSTADQRLDSQQLALRETIERRGWQVVAEVEDVISGAKTSRKGLDELMALVRAGKVDVVAVFKLDRLGRSLPHLAQIIMELDHHGVALYCSQQGIDTSSDNPAARLQLHVLMCVAEFERSIISERTKAGLEAAKKRGKRLGRPKGSKSIPDQRRKLAKKFLAEDPKLSCPKLARAAGISVGTAHRWKQELLQKQGTL